MKIDNIYSSVLIVLVIKIFLVFFVLIPFLIPSVMPNTGVSQYILQNKSTGYILVAIIIILILYFLVVGIYTYRISIDSYTININSNRVIMNFIGKRNKLHISHDMLHSFQIFNRNLSPNVTLVIKFYSHHEKIIVKRFNMSFVGSNNLNQLVDKLNIIINERG